MNIITQLHLTLADGMELTIDSLSGRFRVLNIDPPISWDQNSVTLADLRDILIVGDCQAVVVYDVSFADTPEPVTITIFPDAVVNIVSNDVEVSLV